MRQSIAMLALAALLPTQPVAAKGNDPWFDSGKALASQCFTCHEHPDQECHGPQANGIAKCNLLHGVSPFLLKYFKDHPADPISNPSGMWMQLQTLSNGDMDLVAYYLAGLGPNTYTVSGNVSCTLPNGPLGGATITVTSKFLAGEGQYFSKHTTTTAADGTYSISKLPAGNKYVGVTKPGHLFSIGKHEVLLDFYTPWNPNGGTDANGNPVQKKIDFSGHHAFKSCQPLIDKIELLEGEIGDGQPGDQSGLTPKEKAAEKKNLMSLQKQLATVKTQLANCKAGNKCSK